MAAIIKGSPKIRFEFVPAKKQSTLGGLPALEALAQQFDLWRKIRALPGLDPRTRTSQGYSPELLVAQLLYSFCSGGASLADAERLNDEPLVRQMARVQKFADQTQLHRRRPNSSTNAGSTSFEDAASSFSAPLLPGPPGTHDSKPITLVTGWHRLRLGNSVAVSFPFGHSQPLIHESGNGILNVHLATGWLGRSLRFR